MFKDQIIYLDEVDSTNLYLRRLALNGAPDGQTVIAAKQTAGRGRMDRTFYSQPGGLYMSYLMRDGVENACELTARAAVAVRRAISEVYAVKVDIKWVNDLVLNNRKICGILAQSMLSANESVYILGIGVNMNQGSFPEELNGIASSMLLETGVEKSVNELADNIVKQLGGIRNENRQAVLEEYRGGCLTIRKQITVISADGRKKASALAVNEDFSLRVRYESGEETSVSSGEVSVRGLYDYT